MSATDQKGVILSPRVIQKMDQAILEARITDKGERALAMRLFGAFTTNSNDYIDAPSDSDITMLVIVCTFLATQVTGGYHQTTQEFLDSLGHSGIDASSFRHAVTRVLRVICMASGSGIKKGKMVRWPASPSKAAIYQSRTHVCKKYYPDIDYDAHGMPSDINPLAITEMIVYTLYLPERMAACSITDDRTVTICIPRYKMDLDDWVRTKCHTNKEKHVVITGLANDLEHITGRGVCHRDLKHSNIMVNDGRVIIIDFDMSIPVCMKEATGICATEWVRPPEMKDGCEYDPAKTDVWGFACTVIFILTGEYHTYQGRKEADDELMYLHDRTDFALNSDAVRPWEPVLRACLALDPQKRPTPIQVLQMLKLSELSM